MLELLFIFGAIGLMVIPALLIFIGFVYLMDYMVDHKTHDILVSTITICGMVGGVGGWIIFAGWIVGL